MSRRPRTRLGRLGGRGRGVESPLSPAAAAFVRGLTVGALAGAALVGSALVGARRRPHPSSRSGSGEPAPNALPADADRP